MKEFKFPSGFSIGTTIRGHELTEMSKIEMNDSCPFEKIAKVATRKSPNRQMADFGNAPFSKFVGDQILSGKMVS